MNKTYNLIERLASEHYCVIKLQWELSDVLDLSSKRNVNLYHLLRKWRTVYCCERNKHKGESVAATLTTTEGSSYICLYLTPLVALNALPRLRPNLLLYNCLTTKFSASLNLIGEINITYFITLWTKYDSCNILRLLFSLFFHLVVLIPSLLCF